MRYWSKIAIFHSTLHSISPLGGGGGPVGILLQGLVRQNWNGVATDDVTSNRFDTIPACDRQTGGRTDRRTDILRSIVRGRNVNGRGCY